METSQTSSFEGLLEHSNVLVEGDLSVVVSIRLSECFLRRRQRSRWGRESGSRSQERRIQGWEQRRRFQRKGSGQTTRKKHCYVAISVHVSILYAMVGCDIAKSTRRVRDWAGNNMAEVNTEHANIQLWRNLLLL